VTASKSISLNEGSYRPGIRSQAEFRRITLGFATREMFEAYRVWLESGAAHEAFGDWADNSGTEREQARASRRNAGRCPCGNGMEGHSYGWHDVKNPTLNQLIAQCLVDSKTDTNLQCIPGATSNLQLSGGTAAK
jgi:hypothetical protein